MKKFVIESPDGSVITLDEETTARLEAIAKKTGVSMETALKRIMSESADQLETIDAMIKRVTNPEVGKA